MEIPGLMSLLKLLISIQELILIPEQIPILKSILIRFPELISIPRSIPIPEATYSEIDFGFDSSKGIGPGIDSEHGIRIG